MKQHFLTLAAFVLVFSQSTSLQAAGSNLYNPSYLPGETQQLLDESKQMQEDRKRNPGAYYETPSGYVKGTPPPARKKARPMDDPAVRRQLQLLEDMLGH